jgi:hypothetical protein
MEIPPETMTRPLMMDHEAHGRTSVVVIFIDSRSSEVEALSA